MRAGHLGTNTEESQRYSPSQTRPPPSLPAAGAASRAAGLPGVMYSRRIPFRSRFLTLRNACHPFGKEGAAGTTAPAPRGEGCRSVSALLPNLPTAFLPVRGGKFWGVLRGAPAAGAAAGKGLGEVCIPQHLPATPIIPLPPPTTTTPRRGRLPPRSPPGMLRQPLPPPDPAAPRGCCRGEPPREGRRCPARRPALTGRR